ncbi:hypothetical protein ACJRO7_005281 [Eucalyptus globulus]|uniref:Uncharacterized protein n=1 Tax=Eucalyptus globulus TaxID=34317 RepID=A0ABD3J536_EUCGL
MTTPAPTDFKNTIAVAKAVLSTTASVTATAMVVQSMVHTIVPRELQGFLLSRIRGLFSRFSRQMSVVVDEYDGFVQNELFEAARIFLAAKQTFSMMRIRVSKPKKENHFTVAMGRNQALVDTFHGVEFKWVFASRQIDSSCRVHHGRNSTVQYEVQYFELTFHKKHKEIVLNSYLPFVISKAKSMKQGKKTLKLHTPSFDGIYGGPLSDAWASVNLDHPATSETLAMDLDLKKTIMADLERFVRRKEYYKRVGKAWKRGYLFLIAAMANYLNFNTYDLELSGLRSNADLRRLLVATANHSILVVEDIDCNIELQDRKSETRAARTNYLREDLTLSGFLNFIDGLWSSCGDEWIIVFTTNHKEKLDPALLRPRRMDVHVHMSYCTPLITVARVTPAEVVEQLMKSDEPEVTLKNMLSFLINHKRKETEEVTKEKVCRCQLVEENGGTGEESGKCEIIEE